MNTGQRNRYDDQRMELLAQALWHFGIPSDLVDEYEVLDTVQACLAQEPVGLDEVKSARTKVARLFKGPLIVDKGITSDEVDSMVGEIWNALTDAWLIEAAVAGGLDREEAKVFAQLDEAKVFAHLNKDVEK